MKPVNVHGDTKLWILCRELSVQVECGDDPATMNGVANSDELKRVEELGDNYRGSSHCHNEASDTGVSPLEDGAAQRPGTAVDQLECQVR